MLSSQDWWNVISNYNESIFPMQLVVMLVGIVATLYLIYRPNAKANVVIKGYLSFCNLWIGSVFFMVLGEGFGSPLKYIQGTAFITIGLFLAIDIFTKRTQFAFPKNGFIRYSTIGLLIVVAIYPVVGVILGRSINELIYPGTLPCATTALALIFFSAALPKANKATYALLLVWALPFAPLIQIPKYHVYEDGIMFGVGVYALIAFVVSIIKAKKRIDLKSHKEIFQIKKDAVFTTSSVEGLPNIVPIHSKHLISNKKILISDQFMNKTKNNILSNPYGVLAISEGNTLYKISGCCQYKTSGFMYKLAVKGAKKYAKKRATNKTIKISCKGIVLMTVQKLEIVTV
jgi:predicted pyridoxine 5'-phosphate oxidase superfamily flavin-nucleotide-binding protein